MKRLFSLLLSLALLFPVTVFAKVANDPFAKQWSYEKIGAYDAWDISTGSRNVVVAVIDNGFDHFHPDLKDNVWINTDEVLGNKIDDDNNGYIDDVYGWNFVVEDRNNDGVISKTEAFGSNNPRPPVVDVDPSTKAGQVLHHGSVVAGIIGAMGNNRRLGTGLNWEVKLMNLRLIDNDGRGQTVALGRAITYAVDNGADVINFSIVSNDFSDDVKEAIDYAYEEGVVVVAAAGNNAMSLNSIPLYPVCADSGLDNPRVLGVSAIQEDRRIAAFSNYGSNCIDITAPGVDIGSLLRYGPEDGYPEQYATGWSGTSFAAPFVSATAALIKAVQPSWTNTQIYEAILSTTDKTPPEDETTYANLFGKGLLQVDRALALAIESEEAPEVVKPTPTVIKEDAPGELKPDIHLASLSQGLVRVKYTNRPGLGTTIEVPEMQYADYIEQYVDKTGDIYYVTSGYLEEGELSEIHVFNEAWEIIADFLVDDQTAGKRPALADVTGDELPEVVLAPVGHRTERYSVYDLDGERLYVVDGEETHKGAVINYLPRAGRKDSVIIGVQLSDETRVEQYDEHGDFLTSFTTEQLEQPGSIIAADLEGDGTQEVIMSAAKSEATQVVYYRLADGQLLRNFPAYAPGLQLAVRFSAADFDLDGDDDVLISSADSTDPMRVWNKGLKRIHQLSVVESSLFPTHAFLVPASR